MASSSLCAYNGVISSVDSRNYSNVKLSCSLLSSLSSSGQNNSLQFLDKQRSLSISSIPRPVTVISMAPPKPGGKPRKVVGVVKLALEAGKATPAPPVGPALGAKGVNIAAFCKDYNARTADKAGYVIPVEITVFDDRSFTFILKTPPASVLLLKAAGLWKLSFVLFLLLSGSACRSIESSDEEVQCNMMTNAVEQWIEEEELKDETEELIEDLLY